MMDEDKLRLEVDRAFKAKQLLENEMLIDTFAYLRQSYIDAWTACKTPELREAAWYLLKGLERVEGHLHTVLDQGKLAQHEITELVKSAGRRRAA